MAWVIDPDTGLLEYSAGESSSPEGGGGSTVDLSFVTAGAKDILSGAVGASSSGSPVYGSISKKSAATYTPSTSNQTIAAGLYLSGVQTIKGDANLAAANIRAGKSIFGKAGSFTSDATATAADILEGKTAGVNGQMVTGTLVAGGGSMEFYKCVSVDTGVAIAPYQDAKVSGVTAPDGFNGDYIVVDPTNLHTSRIFRQGNYQLGYDHNNKAWCFNEGDVKPDYVSSVFYAKIEGLSTEDGSFSNPIWWDSEGVATSDRTITGDYNTGEAPYDDYNGYEGWNFYVRLKAGVEYTIGMSVPTGDDYWFDWYFYLKDTNGNTIATASEHDTPVTIGGKGINVYLTYTPTEDGLFVIQAQEETNGLETPIACSPAPEISTNPTDELFEQTNWKVGGGKNAGFEVVSAGMTDRIQKFYQIEGNNVGFDSVWQSEDGTLYVWLYEQWASERAYRWYMTTEKNVESGYVYGTRLIYLNDEPLLHPSMYTWDYRNSSSMGDYPVTKITEMSGVSGSPVLTPIEREGRENLGYATWSGLLLEQDENGVYQETDNIKEGMTTDKYIPIPGKVYDATGSIYIPNLYRGEKGVLYGQGESGYFMVEKTYTPVTLTDIRFKTIAHGSGWIYGIDYNGKLYSWGYNSYGNLGIGNTTYRTEPILIPATSGVTFRHVSCGQNHSCAIDTEGYLWTCGNNYYGHLCNGNTTQTNTLTKQGDKKWKWVSARYNNTMLIDEDGYMWVCGYGSNGQLGTGNTSDVRTLTKLGDKKWSKIFGAIDAYRTFALDTDGYLWATGYNNDGSLGIDVGSYVYTFTKVDNQKWKMVATCVAHTLAINAEGYLFGWGKNNIGQLGTGDDEYHYTPFKIGTKKWKWVSAATNASYAIDEYGQLFWFGGDTGYATPYRAFKPTRVDIPGICTQVELANDYSVLMLTNE